ncbi:hypothetical protein BUALT_Bualt10G0131500 [Buddleja alternifolia]|uniref:Uncharacterized protein n=1 Tax=Buddleja alternifolia TaxID=168488 RepID=A0AAV6X6Z9_9LAMI|nr:hypothetical protein BUALT_Bualt10G0131400 [Buddleja alternifolia]KAG8375737.1 hypothetical protein BUALT_Bualt10G0131500 [Buddleja alternifolia]
MQLCCGLRWRSSISPESQGLYGCTRGVDFAQQYKRVALIGPQNQGILLESFLLAKMDQKTIKEISNRAGINCDEGEFVGYQDSVQSGLNLFVSISIDIACEKANKVSDDISGSVEIVTKSCKTKFVDDDAEDYPRRSSRKVKRRLFYGDESGEDDQPIINCIKRKRD